MPVSFSIDRSLQTVSRRFFGTVTFEELVENRQQILCDPAFDPTFSHLIDARDAHEFVLGKGQLLTLAYFTFAPEARRKAVVLANLAHYGLARMYLAQSREDENRIRLCFSLEEACAWLGLDPGALPDMIPR